MRKEWVETDHNCVAFPDTKSGAQIRAAGDAAIVELMMQGQHSASPYVFPADWGDCHFIGVIPVLDRVCARTGLENATPHVLRHTFASIAVSLGFSELTVSGLLGHGSRGMTQRYVHLDAALVIAADQISAEITRLLDGGELMSMKQAKRMRYVESVRAFAEA